MTLSLLHGKHSFKTGVEVRASVIGHGGTFRNRGRGQVTFDDLPSFLAGNLGTNNGQVFLGDPRRHVTGQAYAAFFQDDWRVTQRLIVNLGLRYEYQTPIKEANLIYWRIGIRQPASLQLRGSTPAGCGTPIKTTSPHAWDSPGISAAMKQDRGSWRRHRHLRDANLSGSFFPSRTRTTLSLDWVRTRQDSKSARRQWQAEIAHRDLGPSRLQGSRSVLRRSTGTRVPHFTQGTSIPHRVTQQSQLKCGTDKLCTAQATNQNLRSAYVMQWSLGIQRSITNNLSLSLDYVGNRADKLLGLEYTNTPPIGAGWTGATAARHQAREANGGQLGTCFAVFNGTTAGS